MILALLLWVWSPHYGEYNARTTLHYLGIYGAPMYCVDAGTETRCIAVLRSSGYVFVTCDNAEEGTCSARIVGEDIEIVVVPEAELSVEEKP